MRCWYAKKPTPNVPYKLNVSQILWVRRLSIQQLQLICQQLSFALDSGMPLTAALLLIGTEMQQPLCKKFLLELAEWVRQGRTFTQALQALLDKTAQKKASASFYFAAENRRPPGQLCCHSFISSVVLMAAAALGKTSESTCGTEKRIIEASGGGKALSAILVCTDCAGIGHDAFRWDAFASKLTGSAANLWTQFVH